MFVFKVACFHKISLLKLTKHFFFSILAKAHCDIIDLIILSILQEAMTVQAVDLTAAVSFPFSVSLGFFSFFNTTKKALEIT
jgi:hypothetical protein